ncbi:hypothetical protein AN958_02537 [Leucoagaricus sp. SymC.cos]|nr:hypothetical protein AN958_02537 [Leucoagaricus sp. SymC.cos]
MPFGTTNTSSLVLSQFLRSYSSTLLHVKINPPFRRTAHYHGAPLDTEPIIQTRAKVWFTISDLLLRSRLTLSNLESIDITPTGSINTTLSTPGRSADAFT